MNNTINEIYKSDLLNHEKWHKKGLDLLETAKQIEPKIKEYWDKESKRKELSHFLDSYLMICSFAIENLLKGIIVFRNKQKIEEEITKTFKLPKLMQEHDLTKLCENLKIDLIYQNQKDLLIRLSRAAIWQGRYPIPLFSNKLPIENIKSFGVRPSSGKIIGICSQSDIKDIHDLISEIKNEYKKT